MALIEEQDKPKINIVSIIIWIVILALLGFGAYYLFLKKPELGLSKIVPSDDFSRMEQFAKINLKPEAITKDAKFLSLVNYIPWQGPEKWGRSNPFSGF